MPAAPPREIPAVLRRIGFEGLAGRSRAIARVLDQVRHVAPTRSPVLIVGEPGTGRGLLAWTIHSSSPRRSRPFMRQACEGPDAAALEVDVFGRGPRTGGRPGFLESGDGGTLFLDEIAALEARFSSGSSGCCTIASSSVSAGTRRSPPTCGWSLRPRATWAPR